MNRRYFNLYEYNIRNWKEIFVTLLLIALNLAVFIYGFFDKEVELNLSMIVNMVTEKHEYYRLFTYMFLHFGLKHFLMNMVVLFGLGRIFERFAGHIKMLVIYLLSGIGGSAMLMYMGDEFIITAGASGAIFGIMGAMIVYMVLNRDYSMLYQMVLMLMINLISTFTDEQVSLGGHLGGLAAGIVLGVILIRREYE